MLASADGGVFAFGDATFEGSAGSLPLQGPIVAMALTPDAKGYWLGALDGGVFAYGDAPFYGSMGSTHLNQPIVGMTATPDGKGYWLVAADGGIFAYGDAGFYGSTGGIRLNEPIVGMAATHDGKGYWLVAADGGIFNFGDANFYGSAGSSEPARRRAVGMVASPDGGGYLIATENGVVLPYGDAQAFGGLSLDPTATQISAIIGNNQGTGYWLLDPQAWRTASPPPRPSRCSPARTTIADAVASQIFPDPDTQGLFCNPYGPCEQWCALFATWAWEQAGIPIPRYAFTGDIWGWAAAHGRDLSADGHAGGRRRRAVRHRPAEHLDLRACRDRDPGLARRRHHDGRRRLGPGPRRLPVDRVGRAVPAGRLGFVQRRADLRLRPAVGPTRARLARGPCGEGIDAAMSRT